MVRPGRTGWLAAAMCATVLLTGVLAHVDPVYASGHPDDVLDVALAEIGRTEYLRQCMTQKASSVPELIHASEPESDGEPAVGVDRFVMVSMGAAKPLLARTQDVEGDVVDIVEPEIGTAQKEQKESFVETYRYRYDTDEDWKAYQRLQTDAISDVGMQEDGYVPDGGHITKRGGVFMGPSGKETYYNLPMQGVVNIMRRMGYSEDEWPYWVRDDGAKMLGDYIIVAANLDLRPRGTIVPTSLGDGIVCDTGGFAVKNPTQLDLALDW